MSSTEHDPLNSTRQINHLPGIRSLTSIARYAAIFLLCIHCCSFSLAQSTETTSATPRQFSGIYPHLAYWNPHNECGTGAVVPWADRLWVITYAPHEPNGSKDKLYSIDEDLKITPFAGSVGGTPANRMIHRESNQLLIGPYVINSRGNVRVIPPTNMLGRLTGTARHLFEPEKKVYYATMEEGLYEVDLETLAVVKHFADTHDKSQTSKRAGLPGYHGKGLYSGQGRLIYANNGERSKEALISPDIPSGVLAEWDGKSDKWTVVRRNQFTDIRGPGGLYGNANPETDPIWAIGWDSRSLLLMLLDGGEWFMYRLPKASHCYDGAHGWNTEWPRFQDVGEDDLVMNMHGMFWKFPKTFCRSNSAGIRPRSSYLKVIGDYCRWGNRLVFGCDDTAKSEFLNKRRAKGKLEPPGQSHSNLWFADPAILDQLGPALGRGAVWLDDEVKKNEPSDPFYFGSFEHRVVHVVNDGKDAVDFEFEIDANGNNRWTPLLSLSVPAGGSLSKSIADEAEWIRVKANRDCRATVQFHFANSDSRDRIADSIFDGLADGSTKSPVGGLIRVRGNDIRKLAFVGGAPEKFYELDGDMRLQVVDDAQAHAWTASSTAIPKDILFVDRSSVLYVDDDGNRWRLPKGDPAFDQAGPLGLERIDREVATERDLFNCHGSFYELPARNAGGFAKIRPVCTHNRRIKDYCSYRGMLILTGLDSAVLTEDVNRDHIIRSDDGAVALWAGVIDDLWKFGKAFGVGGPWHESQVKAGVPSDPYLMTGYDKKSLAITNAGNVDAAITVEVDITGTGKWIRYQEFEIAAGAKANHEFPPAFNAYWIRFVSSVDTQSTAVLTYE